MKGRIGRTCEFSIEGLNKKLKDLEEKYYPSKLELINVCSTRDGFEAFFFVKRGKK